MRLLACLFTLITYLTYLKLYLLNSTLLSEHTYLTLLCLRNSTLWMDQNAILHGIQRTPPPKKGEHIPQFSTHVQCGQTVSRLSYC